MLLTNNDRNEAETAITAHFILGTRYYLSSAIGLHFFLLEEKGVYLLDVDSDGQVLLNIDMAT